MKECYYYHLFQFSRVFFFFSLTDNIGCHSLTDNIGCHKSSGNFLSKRNFKELTENCEESIWASRVFVGVQRGEVGKNVRFTFTIFLFAQSDMNTQGATNNVFAHLHTSIIFAWMNSDPYIRAKLPNSKQWKFCDISVKIVSNMNFTLTQHIL